MDVFKEITEEQKAIIQNICERFNKEFNKNTENQHLETSSSTRSDTSRKIQTETNLRDDTNHLEASALTSPNVTGAIKKTSASINEITHRQRTKIERVFDCFDVNKIGKLETKYLKWALNALGIRTEKGDIEKMLSETEDEESETLSYEEFIYLVAPMIAKMKAKKMAKKMAKKKRREAKNNNDESCDDDNTTKIWINPLKRAAECWQKYVTQLRVEDTQSPERDVAGNISPQEDESPKRDVAGNISPQEDESPKRDVAGNISPQEDESPKRDVAGNTSPQEDEVD